MPTILVVDDEPIVLRVLKVTLEFARYRVLAAASAADAIRQANAHEETIGLLIFDHTLDAVGGGTFVKEMLAARPDMKTIRISGHLERDLQESKAILPGSSFLQKPFSPRQLLDRVRQEIGEPGNF